MAKRPTPTESQRAVLTVDQMRRGIARLQKRIDDLEAFDPTSVQKRWSPEVNVLEKVIDETLAAVFGHNTIEYNRYCYGKSLDHGLICMGQESSPHEVHQYLAEGKKAAVLTLQQAICGLEEGISEQDHITPPINSPSWLQFFHAKCLSFTAMMKLPEKASPASLKKSALSSVSLLASSVPHASRHWLMET